MTAAPHLSLRSLTLSRSASLGRPPINISRRIDPIDDKVYWEFSRRATFAEARGPLIRRSRILGSSLTPGSWPIRSCAG